MAIGAGINIGDNAEYNGKITGSVVLSCIIAATGGLLFGYDTGVTGGVTSMDPFLKKFFPEVYNQQDTHEISNYCKYDNQLLTAFSSSIYISGLLASFFASRITRDSGRKRSILIGGVAFLIGSVVSGASQNIYTLIFGRLLLGVGVGFANQSVPLYLSEMSPPRHRGAFSFGFQLCISVGTTAAFLVNYATSKIESSDLGWRISLATAAVPASVLIAGTLFLPETPNSLIQRGRDAETAKQLLRRIRGVDDVDAELDDLLAANRTFVHPFRKILKRRYRPHLVMAVAVPFFQQMTGITVISFYAPILFRTIGSDESASLASSLVTSALGIVLTFASALVVDRLGRRVVFVFGGFLMLVTQSMIGGVMWAELGDEGALTPGRNVLVVVLICAYVAGFALSWGPLGWLVTSEIFPLEIRSAGQSVVVGVSFLFSFVVGQAFLVILCRFKWGTFFFFGGWVAVMTGFVYCLLPETKNVPIEKMGRVWREHWFWRRYVCDDAEIREPFLYTNVYLYPT